MASRNDLIRSMQNIQNAIQLKGGNVSVANRNPTPLELKNGVDSIPQIILTSANGYTIVCTEVAGVKFTCYKGETQIGTEQTVSSSGDTPYQVMFYPTENGSYTITAKNADNTTKWTRTINISSVGIYKCKTTLPLRDYVPVTVGVSGTTDISAIKAFCNAKVMNDIFDYNDYFLVHAYMGNSSGDYNKCYYVGDGLVDGNGNNTGATFMFTKTPSSYAYYSTRQLNGVSYIGSTMRQLCIPMNVVYYRYDDTVTSATSGTYYIYDKTNKVFESKTLPDEYVARTKYYTQQTTASDGAIYTNLSWLSNNAVAVKHNVWGGYGGSITSSSLAVADDTYIETVDKFWVPTCEQLWGNKIPIISNYWCYNRNFIEKVFEGFYNLKDRSIMTLTSYHWFATPGTDGAGYSCIWYHNYGNIQSYSTTSSFSVPVCFCL